MTGSTERYAIRCGGCGQTLQVRRDVLGRKAKCPRCQKVFRAPLQAPIAAAATQTTGHEMFQFHDSPSGGDIPGIGSSPTGPAGTRRCDRCHQFVLINEFDAHYRQHLGKRADGQLNTYPSLPPEKRWRGDLSTVPQFYRHSTCGSVTGMPDAIIRTYLVNPYFYACKSYCGGCERHVPQRELTWIRTGENLADYTDRLKAAVPHSARYRRQAIQQIITVAVILGGLIGAAAGLAGFLTGGMLTGLLSFLVTALFGSILGYFWLLRIRGGI